MVKKKNHIKFLFFVSFILKSFANEYSSNDLGDVEVLKPEFLPKENLNRLLVKLSNQNGLNNQNISFLSKETPKNKNVINKSLSNDFNQNLSIEDENLSNKLETDKNLLNKIESFEISSNKLEKNKNLFNKYYENSLNELKNDENLSNKINNKNLINKIRSNENSKEDMTQDYYLNTVNNKEKYSNQKLMETSSNSYIDLVTYQNEIIDDNNYNKRKNFGQNKKFYDLSYNLYDNNLDDFIKFQESFHCDLNISNCGLHNDPQLKNMFYQEIMQDLNSKRKCLVADTENASRNNMFGARLITQYFHTFGLKNACLIIEYFANGEGVKNFEISQQDNETKKVWKINNISNTYEVSFNQIKKMKIPIELNESPPRFFFTVSLNIYQKGRIGILGFDFIYGKCY